MLFMLSLSLSLSLYQNLVQRDEEDAQQLFQQAHSALKNKGLPLTCANLDQIMCKLTSRVHYDQNNQQTTQELFESGVGELLKSKQNIAYIWIAQAILKMTIAKQEVLNLIVGTKYYPGGLLAKLCIKTTKEEETLYELRDTQLKNTLRQQFGKLKILDQTASIMMQCAIIIDCGNYIKNHDMTASHHSGKNLLHLTQKDVIFIKRIKQKKLLKRGKEQYTRKNSFTIRQSKVQESFNYSFLKMHYFIITVQKIWNNNNTKNNNNVQKSKLVTKNSNVLIGQCIRQILKSLVKKLGKTQIQCQSICEILSLIITWYGRENQ
ncbi:Hypothetical_protein [Hexamita inflata]|uniref:Hypothetical_protein n=1 Tax=Hexamita inflata TaxID=28002 RepID=A0ABP1H8R9_9EUKA